MFKGCSSLKSINLSNFNSVNNPDMFEIFHGCSSLENIECEDILIINEFEKINYFYD